MPYQDPRPAVDPENFNNQLKSREKQMHGPGKSSKFFFILTIGIGGLIVLFIIFVILRGIFAG